MLEQLRARPGGADIPAVIGDMADVGVEGPYDLAYLVYNTLFNLPDQGRQVDCFVNVGKVLAPRSPPPAAGTSRSTSGSEAARQAGFRVGLVVLVLDWPVALVLGYLPVWLLAWLLWHRDA